MILSCTVNKKLVRLECEPGEALADVLRAAGYKEVKRPAVRATAGFARYSWMKFPWHPVRYSPRGPKEGR
jgi:hypothetical protein